MAGIGALAMLLMAPISQGDETPIRARRRILVPRPGLDRTDTVIAAPNAPGLNSDLVAALVHKPLTIAAEGSQTFNFGDLTRARMHDLPADGQIWLVLTTSANQPLVGAKPEDIQITVLSSQHDAPPVVNVALSKPELGLWNISLPKLHSGNHFYLIHVSARDETTRMTYDGQILVRAVHTTILVLTGQRPDGTMWYVPPGGQ